MTAAQEARRMWQASDTRRTQCDPGWAHRTSVPLLSQDAPSDLRTGDQPATPEGQPNVRVMTMTEVASVSGQRGDYAVTLKLSPRYVNTNCTACGDCAAAVGAEIYNPYEYGLAKTKAAYLPHNMAYPMQYMLDPSVIGTADAD